MRPLLILGLILIVVFFVNISFGSVPMSLSDILSALLNENENQTLNAILWQFRLPKAVTCVLAGAVLSLCGLLMQTFFRNPLAGPDVLGLSSGASLMVAILILTKQSITAILVNSPLTIAMAAGLGSALVFLAVMFVANYVRDNTSLLIIGLMISAATSSIVGVLQFVSRAEDLQTFMIWSLGSVGGTSWPEITALLICAVIGTTITVVFVKSLNAWLLGSNYAQSLGINLERSRFWIVTGTSLMAGAVTAFCGPIAFVGLAVPHLVRLFISTTNHKILIPSVMLGGAILLLLCDLIAHLPGDTQLLPLNAVTSLIGAPVVIWMVMKNKQVRV